MRLLPPRGDRRRAAQEEASLCGRLGICTDFQYRRTRACHRSIVRALCARRKKLAAARALRDGAACGGGEPPEHAHDERSGAGS